MYFFNELEGPVRESKLFQGSPVKWFVHNKMLCGVVKGFPICSSATQSGDKWKGYKKKLGLVCLSKTENFALGKSILMQDSCSNIEIIICMFMHRHFVRLDIVGQCLIHLYYPYKNIIDTSKNNEILVHLPSILVSVKLFAEVLISFCIFSI
jgi:hypothetical protein